MRHRKKFNHLSRTSAHRKAMLSNMATSLILHKRITTTVTKAKALRTYIEPLITKSKEDTTHSRRVVFSYLRSKEAVSELFREISTKVVNRPGGYTRIIKMGNRLGDNAEMCLIELVDYNEHLLGAEKESAKTTGKRRRRRGGGGKKQQEQVAAETTAQVTEENAVTDAEPATEETAPPEAAKATDHETVTEEPKAEEPKAEEPKAEEPKAEEPKAEEPKAEEPKAEESKAEEPETEAPKAEETDTEKKEEKSGE